MVFIRQADFPSSSFCLWLWLRKVLFTQVISRFTQGNFLFFSFGISNVSVCTEYSNSFVRRLKDDLAARFDPRAAPNFHIPETGHVLYPRRLVALLVTPTFSVLTFN